MRVRVRLRVRVRVRVTVMVICEGLLEHRVLQDKSRAIRIMVIEGAMVGVAITMRDRDGSGTAAAGIKSGGMV